MVVKGVLAGTITNPENLRLVVQVQRHGNRGSSKVYRHLVKEGHEHENFEEGRALHYETAVPQLQKLAGYSRQKYAAAFDFNVTGVRQWSKFFRAASTDTERTLESARITLEHLFPNMQSADLMSKLEVRAPESDLSTHLGKKNCKLYDAMRLQAAQSDAQAYIAEFVNFLALKWLKPLRLGLLEHHSDLSADPMDSVFITDRSDTELNMLLDNVVSISSYVHWAHAYAGIPMKFLTLDKGIYIPNMCEIIVETKLYSKVHAHNFLNQLPAYKLLFDEVVPEVRKALVNDGPAQYRYFMTHQETLGPLLQSVGFETYRRSEPGASLFFEVYKKGQETRVVTHYRTEENPDLKLYHYDQSSEDFFELLEDVYSEFTHVFGDRPAKRICDMDWEQFEALCAEKGMPFELVTGKDYLQAMSRQLHFDHILEEFDTKYNKEMKKLQEMQIEDL